MIFYRRRRKGPLFCETFRFTPKGQKREISCTLIGKSMFLVAVKMADGHVIARGRLKWERSTSSGCPSRVLLFVPWGEQRELVVREERLSADSV